MQTFRLPKPLLLTIALIAIAAEPARAQTVVATHTIRSQTILTAADLDLIDQSVSGAYISLDEVVGMEARVVLYPGRPIRIDDIGPPALIERNQIVTLYYTVGALSIATDARALGRGGVGDRLRVMNLSSRNTVTGWVQADGSVSAGSNTIPLH